MIVVMDNFLHAKKLGFIHPTTKEYMEFESELPDYFKVKLDELEEEMKMSKVINWTQYFMGVAKLSAFRSKDPNTQVGACNC